MTDDLEWSIRAAGKDLAGLFTQLDAAKYDAIAPKGERVMRPRPGPRTPGNWFAVALDADLVDRIVEYVVDARNRIAPAYTVGRDGAVLCEWIAFNANAIAELDFAPDLLEELHTQAANLNRRLNPPDAGTVANQDPYLTADSIQRSLTSKGLACPEGTIRYWVSEGRVDTKTRRDGRRAYRLADIISQLSRRHPS